MKIAFLGAARTVTGSQHLLTINNRRLLIDCGLYQGSAREAEERNRSFAFDPKEIDAVILTHAHIDHSGNLPNLVKQGFTGPIYATPPTAALADIMLRDAAHIQEADAEYINQKNQAHGKPAVKPLYTQDDALAVNSLIKRVDYNEPFEPVPGAVARMREAGHILGSAAVALEVEENGQKRSVWFSGDIGRRNLPLVRNPVLPQDVDTLVMECTYGDKSHADPEKAVDELREILLRVIERKGKIIVPAFAVGRTQELVYSLHKFVEAGEIPAIPVYVDSPLAVEASQIFVNHPEFLDQEAQNFMRDQHSDDALGFGMLSYIKSAEESRGLNDLDGPLVIISASGMAETGRIVHHLARNLADPRNAVLIVSFQAPGTLGRALADGEKTVEIFDDPFPVKAEVIQVAGFSAHAGQNLLQEYALASQETLQQVFLVHGEEQPAKCLQAKLKEQGLERVYFPYLRQTMEI